MVLDCSACWRELPAFCEDWMTGSGRKRISKWDLKEAPHLLPGELNDAGPGRTSNNEPQPRWRYGEGNYKEGRVDETKLVKHLGGSGLAMPVEIVPFCWKFTAQRLELMFAEAGCVAKLRKFSQNGEPFVTDNGNYIIDLYFKKDIGNLKAAISISFETCRCC